MNRVFTLFSFACLSFYSAGYNYAQEADSIYALLLRKPDKFSTVKELAASANSLASSNPLEAIKLARYIINLSSRLDYTEGKAIGYNELGNAFERRSDFDSAFHNFFISYRLFSAIKNQEGMANTMINIGNAHEIISSYDSAAYYAYRALPLADSTGDPNLKAKNLRVIGNIMQKKNRPEEAIENYLEALSLLCLQNNQPDLKGRICENLALSYMTLSSYDVAENYFREASSIYATTNNPRNLARLNLNIASLRELQGKYEEALNRTHFALRFYEKIDHPNGIAESLITLSRICYKMRRYDEASAHALQTIESVHRRRDLDLEMDACKMLRDINFEKGNYKKAYEYQSTAWALHDSIFSDKKASIIDEMQNRFENEKKEHELKLLNKDNEIKALTIKKQAAFRNSIISLTIAIMVMSILLFNRYRRSEKRRRRHERLRISSDLHDDIGAALNSISIYSEMAKRELGKPSKSLELIGENSRKIIASMSDIVWTINPENDSFENIIDRMRSLAYELLRAKNMELSFYADESLNELKLPMESRKNFFMVFKEALNNLVKYSGAEKAFIDISRKNHTVKLTVQDNGHGFDASQLSNGNGLKNMNRRAEEMGAEIKIISQINMGTAVELCLDV